MRRAPEGGLVALVLVGLVVWMTWPLARHLGTHVYDPAGIARTSPAWVHPDIHLTVWIVAWVARVLPTAPWRLFDAPIFHPAPDALAYSEHLLGAAPITVPAYWLGGALFAHQMLLVATFALSALAMALLVGMWTRSAAAALVAGALYAFAPWRFLELHGVHLECAFYLPLAVLLAQRWLASGRAADLAGMTVALAAQALAAYALAYPAFAAMIPFVGVLAVATRAPRGRLAGALAGVAVAGAMVAVVSLPYLRVQRPEAAPVPVVKTWGPDVLQRTQSARLASYVDGGGATYVGGVSLALAASGLAVGLAGARASAVITPRPLVVAMLAMALPLVLLSLGPHAELFGWRPLAALWDAVPGLRVFRVPQRFGFLVSLPVAVLGGIAAAAAAGLVARRVGGLAAWAMAAALVGAVCWQAPRGAIFVRPFPDAGGTPPVYSWLAQQPCAGDRCAVLEVPAGPSWEADPRAVYWTLAHGHPIANGYSGFAPAAYPLVLSLADQLPSDQARETLTRLTGARWLLVHGTTLLPAERAAWTDATLPRAARFADDVVYELPPPDADWRAYYVEPPQGMTFAGTPLAPLPPGGAASIRLDEPPSVPPRTALRATAVVRNVGSAPWPALTSRSRHRVSLALEWIGPLGPVRGVPVTTVVLPADVAPGEEVRVAARLSAPVVPGTYALEARVVQEGVGPLPGTARVAARVAP